MMDSIAIENRARLARTTCGWPRAGLDREAVRRYWRDVHSPAISRRLGIYQYRHSPFDPVEAALFAPTPGIVLDCRRDEQIQWQSDVVYLDESWLADFTASPPDPAVLGLLLGDIELIVDKSTTYRSVGKNLHTYADRSGDPIPLGLVPSPRYGVFFRQRNGVGEEDFRVALRHMAQQWSEHPGVLRIRMNLFEVPDMEAERKAGYPVKTHPVELQYQAWIDLVLDDPGVGASLLQLGGVALADLVSTVHAYPVPAIYTFVFDGRPTIAGLRGFPAHDAIRRLQAENQTDPRILEWMYGPIVHGTTKSVTR